MKTKVQDTSLVSYYNILGTLGKRQKEVLLCLKLIQPANNLMISKRLGIPINCVCGRMKELRDKKLVRLNHVSACPYTKEQTRFYSIVSYVNDIIQL